MLLTITLAPHTDAYPASDLGFLLHKHPDRVQTIDAGSGTATVFYPESSPARATAALLLEVDPIALVRGKKTGPEAFALGQYVNDRPYAASSLLAVAIKRAFSTAMTGRCDSRPELAASELPMTIHVPACPARRGGADLVRRLFEPLGWQVDAVAPPLAAGLDWGPAPYVDLTLTGRLRLADALSHLYVLLPVLDDAKHYWVGADEVDKLVRRAEGWLASHPERGLITDRYLAHRRSFVSDAVARLAALDDASDDEAAPAASGCVVDEPTDRTPLRQQRLDAVLAVLRAVGARRVADLGCGEGLYLRALLDDPAFTEVLGIDVSARELDKAERRLERLSDSQRARVTLRQGSLTYTDPTLGGFDALLLIEVIEHVEPDRLPSLEASVFGVRAAQVVVTTPNADYNAIYGLASGQLRHPDHRFEWTRSEFADWAHRVAERHGYAVEFRGVGEADDDLGTPTQLALFTREAS